MAKADLIAYLRTLPFLYPKTSGCNGVSTSGAQYNAGTDETDETDFVDLTAIGGTSDFENLSGSPTLETVKNWLSKHTCLTEAQRAAAIAAFNA